MPKSKPFTIAPYSRLDKRIEINGPDGFRMWVDNDDVPHKVAEGGAKKIVRILNAQWFDSEAPGYWERAKAFSDGMDSAAAIKGVYGK